MTDHKDYLRVVDARLLAKNGRDMGAVVLDVDGYYYWWPDGPLKGCLPANFLRMLADLLDELNKPWDDELQAYFDAYDEGLDDDDVILLD